MKIIATDRLLLSPMLASDSPQVVDWRNSSHVHSVSYRQTTDLITISSHLNWFNSTRLNRIDYIISLKSSAFAIGSVAYRFTSSNYLEQSSAELSKYIGEKSHLRKGYAYEATKAWLDFGFNCLGFDVIYARTSTFNHANIRLNEKLGFSIVDNKNLEPIEVWGNSWHLMKMLKSEFLETAKI